MRQLALIGCVLLAGCGSVANFVNTTNAPSNFPKEGSVIPATDIALSPTTTITLEKLIYWGGVGAIAYYVMDPFSPNWDIQEAQFPNDHYHLSLKMKRYYSGGAGEARMVFNHRAKELANAGGFAGYKILEYSEGLESSIAGSQRVSQGVIVLTGPVQQ
ncbi:MAG TPA: hypothetical protein VGK09_15650 [Rhodocyclaceae bacterium]|jgi:hypothetical protein